MKVGTPADADIPEADLERLEAREIQQRQHEGDELGDDRGRRGALDPPAQRIHEDPVQSDIQHRPHHAEQHGIAGTAVGPDGGGRRCSENVERQTDGGYRQVVQGVGVYVAGRTRSAQIDDLAPEKKDQQPRQRSDDGRYAKARVNILPGVVKPPGPLADVEIRRRPDTEQHAEGRRKRRRRENDIGGRVAHHADDMADKDLVGQVVQRADKHADDRRDRVFRDQRHQRSRAQFGSSFPGALHAITAGKSAA